MEKAKNYIAWFYILALFIVVPLYNSGSFIGITQRKVEAFFFISAIAVIMAGIVYLIEEFKDKENDRGVKSFFKSLSALDKAILLFLLTAIIATCFSPYRKESIYGVPGFGTGLIAIFVYVASYFYISRNLKPRMGLFYAIILSSVMPVIIAIVNRLGFDPLGFYLEGEIVSKHQFVSTIGNYGWFSSYLMLIIPIVMYLVVSGENRIIKIASAIYLALCIAAIFMAGTSAAKVLAPLMIGLVIAGKVVKPKEPVLKTIAKFIPVFVISILIIYGVFIMMASNMESFGNGRGYIWELSIRLFKEQSLFHKFVGVGPNCYMYALNDYLSSDAALLSDFTEHFEDLALASAHSESFDYLINMGMFGLMAYISVIILMFKSFLEGVTNGRAKEISILCCVSYLLFVSVHFSIVCATPYFFIFMGIAAGRNKTD